MDIESKDLPPHTVTTIQDLNNPDVSHSSTNNNTTPLVTQPNSTSILSSNFYNNFLPMFTHAVGSGTASMSLMLNSNQLKYILNSTKLLKIFYDLDHKFFVNNIESAQEEIPALHQYIVHDVNLEVIQHSTSVQIEATRYTSDDLSVCERNALLDNNVQWSRIDFCDCNYIKVGQFESAISIFNIERSGWDATHSRIRRQPFEQFKLDVMRSATLNISQHINFLRETIGRILLVKHKHASFLTPKRPRLKFVFDTTAHSTKEEQKKTFLAAHPLGVDFSNTSANDLIIGNLNNVHTTKIITFCNAARVRILGFDSTSMTSITENEIYVSRASTTHEFYYEFCCLTAYGLFNPNFQTITMINPLMSSKKLNLILQHHLGAEFNYHDIYLPLGPLYQVFMYSIINHDLIERNLEDVYTDDFFTVIKSVCMSKFAIKLGDTNFMHLLDYSSNFSNAANTLYNYGNTAPDTTLHYLDSDHILRMLDVLGLIQRINCGRMHIPSRFVQIRHYMKEFSRQLAINTDYIVQRCIGSFTNKAFYPSVSYNAFLNIIYMSVFHLVGGNICIDSNNKVTSLWTKNCLLWSNAYFTLPTAHNTVTFSDANLLNEFIVMRRANWFDLPSYVELETWDFGKSDTTLAKRDNSRFYYFNSTDDYTSMRNMIIRSKLSDRSRCELIYSHSDTTTVLVTDISRAICRDIKNVTTTGSYYYYCEFPTSWIFSFCRSIHLVSYYNTGTLPKFNLYWLNLYNSSHHSQDILHLNPSAIDLEDVFLKVM